MMTANDDRLMKFHAALAASGRSSEISDADDVYGWFVGSWELDVRHYWAVDVSAQGIKGEVHAGWVLEGRAVQDVWIMPRRGDRSARLDKNLNMYGTTLRVWDSSIGAWRITWSNPAGEHFEEQIGRWNNNEIIQVGTRTDNTSTRWRFTEITGESFHWIGESLAPGQVKWKLEGEFLARRVT